MAKMWPFKSFQIFTKNWFLLNQSCNLLLFPPPLLLFPPLALHQLQPSQCLLLCPAPQCTALYPFFTTSELLRTVSGNQQYSALCCYGMSGYVWAADKTSAKLIQPSIALSDAAQQWTFSSEFWQKQPFVWFIDCLAQLQYSPELKKNFSVRSSTFAIFFFHLANAFQRSNSAPNILPRVEKRELRGWVESFDILIVPLPSSFLRPPKNLRPRPRLPWHHDGWALHSWSIFIISSSLPKPCPTTGPARNFFFDVFHSITVACHGLNYRNNINATQVMSLRQVMQQCHLTMLQCSLSKKRFSYDRAYPRPKASLFSMSRSLASWSSIIIIAQKSSILTSLNCQTMLSSSAALRVPCLYPCNSITYLWHSLILSREGLILALSILPCLRRWICWSLQMD